MLSSYTENAKRKTVNIIMLLIVVFSVAVMLFISPKLGLTAILFGALWTAIYCKTVRKQFGGVTGDTAGFFLQVFELVCVFGVWIGALL